MTDACHRLDLAGLGAVVTGAAGGIGLATARLLSARGAVVLGVDRPGTRSPEDEESKGFALGEADLSTADGCSVALADARTRLPPLGALVHAAGVGAFDAPIDTADDDTWDRILAVNLRAIARLSRDAVDLFGSRGGVIVNVSSVHAQRTTAGVAPYAASKGAVEALTRSMAVDLAARRIRVVAVAPGAVDTPMLHQHAAQAGTSLDELGFSRSPSVLGRIADPVEVAEVIAFLCSPAASAVNGSTVTVDAGLLAGL